MTNSTIKYDLEERTELFGENVIKFCKNVNITLITKPFIDQLIRSSTSIGANYMEANGANSKKDFRYKIYICKKESQETKHWLRMMLSADDKAKNKIGNLLQEAQELILIFNKITNSLDRNADDKSKII